MVSDSSEAKREALGGLTPMISLTRHFQEDMLGGMMLPIPLIDNPVKFLGLL